MTALHIRRTPDALNLGGTRLHSSSTLRWLLAITLLAALALLALPVLGATVSGEVVMPVADGGYQPSILGKQAQVRVLGTSLVANVVPVDRYHGTFSIPNVPTGPVTLLYVEPDGEDSFTMASRRVHLDVAGNVSGVGFDLVHHWKYLPTYPAPWRDPDYDLWEPYFVNDQIGFLMLRHRGISPMVTELWRTLNGGSSWKKVGSWADGEVAVIPDMTGRSMLFVSGYKGVVSSKVSPSAGAPYSFYHSAGVLRTTNGGTTWTYVDLPNVANANGIVAIQNYASISSSRWIACGSENTGGYMGSGTPFAATIWETADSGATWQIKRTWLEDYASCAALGANSAGKAILFATPYAFGGGLHRELRGTSGIWTQQPGNTLVVNSGYGTADIPMVGDEAWASASVTTVAGTLLYHSADAGASWQRVSDTAPNYLDFATPLKGFAAAGAAIMSYDGGATWLLTSTGGGICCHGNYLWAADAMHAIWAEGGVGDPNGMRDVFTYVEPRVPSLEVLPAASIPNATVEPGTTAVRIASYRFANHGPVPLAITGLNLEASGTGDDRLDVTAVRAWLDRDADGVVDADDPLLATGVHAIDNGVVTLNFGDAYPVQPRLAFNVVVTYDFAAGLGGTRTYALALAPATISADTADSDTPLTVSATAPEGTSLPSATVTVQSSVSGLASLTLSKSSTAGCLSVIGTVRLSAAAPVGGLTVTLADTLAAATTPASVKVAAGASSKTFTITTTSVAAPQSGVVRAALGGTTLEQPLTLRPIGLSSLTLTPATVVGGNTSSGLAKLQCVAGPGPVLVEFASAKPATAAPQVASVLVPVGTQTAAFNVSTAPVAARTSAKITATANGVAKSKYLTVTP